MIQQIEPARLDNHYRAARPAPDSPVLCFDETGVLAALRGGSLVFPTWAETGGETVFAFSVGGTDFFLRRGLGMCAGFEILPLRALRQAAPRQLAFAAVTGYHLWRWYRDNQRCGRCGAPLVHDACERALRCACGNIVYPKLCPAVIVAVRSRGRILLTQYSRPDAPWALIAGFAEIGETIEQTVRREVMEECGLRVRDLRYYKSQPWGFSGDLLFGFFCECDGDDMIRLDAHELKRAAWFLPEEIDFRDDGVSLTREMIECFRTGRAD